MKKIEENDRLRSIIVVLVAIILVISITFIVYLSVELNNIKRAINEMEVAEESIQLPKVKLASIVPIANVVISDKATAVNDLATETTLEPLVDQYEPAEECPPQQKEAVKPVSLPAHETKVLDDGVTLIRYEHDTLWTIQKAE